jgi:hypothetical protein
MAYIRFTIYFKITIKFIYNLFLSFIKMIQNEELIRKMINRYIAETKSNLCTLTTKKISWYLWRYYKINILEKPGSNEIRQTLEKMAKERNWEVAYGGKKTARRWIVRLNRSVDQ